MSKGEHKKIASYAYEPTAAGRTRAAQDCCCAAARQDCSFVKRLCEHLIRTSVYACWATYLVRMLRSASACSSERYPLRVIFGSKSASAAATASQMPRTSSSSCVASADAAASSSRPSEAAKRRATSSPTESGAGSRCVSTAACAAARVASAASQWTGSAAAASSSRNARVTVRIASVEDAGRSLCEPTPMRVSELDGSTGGIRPCAAKFSRRSMWPSTRETSSSTCCPARRPPSACGWPLPGAGMPSFISTSGVIVMPLLSSATMRPMARWLYSAASKSADVYADFASPAACVEAVGWESSSVSEGPFLRLCARSVSAE
eukprot:2817223-Pleurochrysis_carterae.AAC.1